MSAVEKFPILLSEAEEESSAVPPCFSDEGINVRLMSLVSYTPDVFQLPQSKDFFVFLCGDGGKGRMREKFRCSPVFPYLEFIILFWQSGFRLLRFIKTKTENSGCSRSLKFSLDTLEDYEFWLMAWPTKFSSKF